MTSGLAVALSGLLSPIRAAATRSEGLVALVSSLGWQPAALGQAALGELAQRASQAAAAAERVLRWCHQPPSSVAELAELVRDAAAAFTAARELGSALGHAAPPGATDAATLGEELLEHLVVSYLQREQPALLGWLQLLTLLERGPQPGAAPVVSAEQALLRVPLAVPHLALGRAAQLIADPPAALRRCYVADDSLDTRAGALAIADRVFPAVGQLAQAIGARTTYGSVKQTAFDADPTAARGRLYVEGLAGADGARIGVWARLLSADEGGPALELVPSGSLQVSQLIGAWRVAADSTCEVHGFRVTRTGVEWLGGGPTSATAHASVDRITTAGEPAVCLGDRSGTRFEIGSLGFSAFLDARNNAVDYGVSMHGGALALVLMPGDNAFLQRLLPAGGLRLGVDLELGWSRSRGLRAGGQLGLEVTLPVNRSFGPILLHDVTLAVIACEGELRVAARVSVGGAFGPFQAAIDGIGLAASLGFGQPGTSGPYSLSFGFEPPSGIGLGLDTGTIAGAGFLEIDHGNYFGAVEIAVRNRFTIRAVGCVITRLPDGAPTFSFKVVGRVDFTSCPIQIGMGFCIVELGGVIAVHCRMDEQVLRDAVYAGTLDAILFPDDLVKNAPTVLARLNATFPPCKGSHVVGALARISWGAGLPVFRADVALVIELGNALTIALAGIVTLVLPNPDAAIVRIKLLMLGVVDFGANTLSFDAKLADSWIGRFAIEGEAALRASWGARPSFAFSLGGFHPAYPPPAGFPALQRMAIIISRGNPNIALLSYFAVTENSCQLGAALVFHWRKDVDIKIWTFHLEASGTAGFDALVMFKPSFSFTATMYASFDLRVDNRSCAALEMCLELRGPNPYHVRGRAKVTILKVTRSVEVEATFGEHIEESRVLCEPLELLEAELANASNWTVHNAVGYGAGVVLADPRTSSAAYAKLDPLADRIDVVQLAVPLETARPITRVGTSGVTAPRTYDLRFAPLGGQPIRAATPVMRPFAPGDFADLEDDEALHGDAYVSYKAGVQAVIDGIEVPHDCLETHVGEYDRILHFAGDRAEGRRGRMNAAVIRPAIQRSAVRRFTHAPLRLLPNAGATGVTEHD